MKTETPRILKWASLSMLLIGLAGLVTMLTVATGAGTRTGKGKHLSALLVGELEKAAIWPEAGLIPELELLDAQGRRVPLDKMSGELRLVNLWATWCAPCMKELPSLARLQAKYKHEQLHIIAVNYDTPGKEKQAWEKLARLTDHSLAFYKDQELSLPSALHSPGFPTTVPYDRKGQAVFRVVG